MKEIFVTAASNTLNTMCGEKAPHLEMYGIPVQKIDVLSFYCDLFHLARVWIVNVLKIIHKNVQIGVGSPREGEWSARSQVRIRRLLDSIP